jgi:hypothetical protein
MNKINVTWGLAIVLILAAVSSRFLPHPHNFTAIGAMALFGGAHFSQKKWAMIIPFAALFLSDLFYNLIVYKTYGFGWWSVATYLSFGLVYLLGRMMLQNVNAKNVILASVSASVLFFFVTNTISWQYDALYTKDFTGLMLSYIAGLPFFYNELAANLLYGGLMFGIFAYRNEIIGRTVKG